MRLPAFRYVRPATVREAVGWLEDHGREARVLAGGTDLLVALKQRRERPAYVVSLAGLQELAYIREEAGALRLGALTTLYTLARSAEVGRTLPALAQAAAAVGAVRLKTLATVGGNLCLSPRCKYYNRSDLWRRALSVCLRLGGERCLVTGRGDRCAATFAADLAPVLLALEASVRLATPQGGEVLPLDRFYPADGDGREPHVLAGRLTGLVTEVEVPLVPGRRCAYRKFRLRGGMDFPLIGVAGAVEGAPDRWERGILAATGVASRPVVLAAGSRLSGRPSPEFLEAVAAEAVRQVHPAPTGHVPVSYLRQVLRHLVREVLGELAGEQGGGVGDRADLNG